ncbi:2TM domain-containing protein [Zunongwangia sp. H14]|uniref:2TM domain-containing protein n=1 Tax=Zunongwangia sp. H14 TaxID=3240792 RepID=UPI00356327A3
METKDTESINYLSAKKRVKKIRGFYIHFVIYLFLNISFFIVGARDEGVWEALGDLSNYSTAFFWGIGLFAHWSSVFGRDLFFGKHWEEKKIKEILQKERRKTWE